MAEISKKEWRDARNWNRKHPKSDGRYVAAVSPGRRVIHRSTWSTFPAAPSSSRGGLRPRSRERTAKPYRIEPSTTTPGTKPGNLFLWNGFPDLPFFFLNRLSRRTRTETLLSGYY